MRKQKFGVEELKSARRSGLGLLIPVLVFSVFVNILMLTGPLFMLQVYDRVLGSRSEETLAALFLLVVFLYALMAVLDYARGRVLARFGARFQSDLDSRVFDVVMRRSLLPQFRAAPASALRDLETIRTVFVSPAMLALFDVPWTPLFVAAIFVFHPLLGWMAIAGGAVLIGATILNNSLTRKKTEDAQTASRMAQGFAEEARSASEFVRAQGMNSAILDRWLGMRKEALERTMNASDWTGFFTSTTRSFRLLLQSAMLAVGAWIVLQGEMTAGAMIASSILLGRALAPIELSIGQWPLVQQALAGWRSLGTLLATVPPEGKTITLPKPAAALDIKNFTVKMPGAKAPTLAGVTFSLAPGEVVGIIGKSGAGKSTLAKAILGLVRPAAGEVRLGGATLDQYAPEDLGRFVGYLPQHISLFSGTVAENIARMSQAPDEKRVVEAAKRANAHQMILSLPDGYQTVIHGHENQLSGGQRQRIALARVFYSDPVLLVLDEPNSALDTEGSEALNRAVREAKTAGNSALIMTHRPAAIAECDRLIVLSQGRIVADGPRDEVLRSMVRNADDVSKSLTQRKRG